MRSSVEGTAFPMRQVNHEEMRLRGFKWQDYRRPKTKEELFSPPKPNPVPELKKRPQQAAN